MYIDEYESRDAAVITKLDTWPCFRSVLNQSVYVNISQYIYINIYIWCMLTNSKSFVILTKPYLQRDSLNRNHVEWNIQQYSFLLCPFTYVKIRARGNHLWKYCRARLSSTFGRKKWKGITYSPCFPHFYILFYEDVFNHK